MIESLFDVPYYLFSEYLTGWTIFLFIIFIIYFIALRKYYLNKDHFYDRHSDDITKEHNSKQHNKKTSNKSNKHINTNNKSKNKNKIEGFEVDVPDTATVQQQDTILDTFIETTLFNNLNLTPEQIKQCKVLYNQIIITYIIDIGKLVKRISTNEYLNGEKQFNSIILAGIDKIINYLNNTIYSMNKLTRTSIKTDLLTILSNTIENLINKSSNKLSNDINELAKLNSTTIDYTTMVTHIDISRKKIEEYTEISKLIANYDIQTAHDDNKVNKVLEKSFILPIYEKNFDRINQLS